MTKDGYPTKRELKKIETWGMGTGEELDPIGLVEYLRTVWYYQEPYFKVRGKKVIRLELHTGGWSGNEDVIDALHKNLFWTFNWVKSVRGGHYYFKFKIGKKKI
jgi:hypothetical protein